jgi:hypothetical protein
MAAEFKIGRLRFTWNGTWTAATFYNRDAVVNYQGKTYACMTPNTSSANFYTDLNSGYWSLVVDGKTWQGPWATSTFYSLGNIVIFGGKVYACISSHTSTTFASNASNWTQYTEFANWNTTWSISTAYGQNDVVKYGGIVYKCIANHTSSASTTLGLEANQAAWTIFYSGIEYKGTWSGTSFRYKTNDVVKYGPDLWIANSGHTSTSTFDPTKWSTWLPGFEFAGTWTVSTVYQPGDTVEYGGYQYASLTVNNTGNIPSIDAIDWQLMTASYEWKSTWNVGTGYKIGDVVTKNGMVFSATADNLGQDPSVASISTTYTATGSSGTTLKVASTANIVAGMNIIGTGFQGQYVVSKTDSVTLVISSAPTGTLTDTQALAFVGVNYVYWSIVSPGTYWTKNWISSSSYSVGDLVVWSNGTYVCVQSHTATFANNGGVLTGNRPDLDTTNTYWVFYIPHSRFNAMNTYGDIETYGSTLVAGVTSPAARQAVPIGTSQYVLRNTGGTPTWTKINIVPQVYYVSNTTGTDRSDYGTTWDQPWKTIQYAVGILGAGTTNLNAATNIKNNKSWITTEMIQWTLYQIANSLNGFTPSYSLDQTKSVRDAGYIIDAIIYDLTRGGNSQTVAAALSYFAFGSSNTFFSSAVQADVPYYLPMLSRLGTLILAALTNTPPAQNYQTINGITLPVLQITSGGAAENGAQTSVTNLLSIITTALTNQSTALVPTQNSGLTYTLNVKTGTYPETLPIVIPENTAINGDELRGVTVSPAISITTNCTATNSVTNLFTVTTTINLADQMPVQFVDPTISSTFAYIAPFTAITAGKTYYVVGSTITPTQFAVTTITGTYSQVTTTNVTGTGAYAEFNVTPNAAGTYSVSLYYGGTGYVFNNVIKILGTSVGGASPANDITIQITGVTNGVITSFQVNSGSIIFPLTVTATGIMTMYAGDCLKDMFRMRNGSGLRNMTLVGLLGTLGAPDANFVQKPTGGNYACLDPGTGPNDTTVWIFRRSPYVQNVTAFGNGCTALKIDGTLHNGGNKSIVCNDFTHIVNDGIGIWCTGPSSLTEAVSVFSYYGYAGYFAENGGRIRATNGNSSYGTYGVISSGYDVTESPATGIIYNQSSQVQATVQSAFGVSSQLLRMNYSNAGSGYGTTTTNYLSYSNNFLGTSWTSDSNVTFAKVNLAPTGLSEAWTLAGTGSTNSSYIYQNITIPSAGATYTAVTPTNISGSGVGATFNITVTSTAYTIIVNNGGSGYAVSNQLLVQGSVLGGVNSVNDCIITVTGLAGSVISNVTVTGTVPTNSALNYTCSLFVKQGTATSIDLQAIYSGSSTVTSSINYNFTTGITTPSNPGGGFLPVNYGALNQQLSTTSPTAGWIRIWMAVNDTTGLNTQLQFRIYPKGISGTANTYNLLYGAQVELSKSTYIPSFYLEVAGTSRYTAYANFNIIGAGTGVVAVGDETRNQSVFETRVVTDSNGITGGAGYLTASNNSQGGTTSYVILAQSDSNTNANYTGMRVFINSGTGAGQYGYISYYNTVSKYVYVLQESFTPLTITSTTGSGTNTFTLGGSSTTTTLYQGMPVQFIPTYYTTSVTSTSLQTINVTASVGGTSNYFTVSSTLGLSINTLVTFTAGGGAIFGGVSSNYNFYIYSINPTINGVATTNTIQVTQQQYGTLWSLSTVASGNMTMNFSSNNSYLQGTTANMVVNYPIQFTGTSIGGISIATTYYIKDVIDAGNFTISGSLVTVTASATTAGTVAGLANNYWNTTPPTITATATSLIALSPIIFTNVVGGVTDSQKYYISTIQGSNSFSIATSIISVTATATSANPINLITVSSTTGFQVNYPIKFVGITFGGANIVAETIYYILVVNDATTFTISTTPGGSAVQLTAGTGSMTVITCPAHFALTTAGSGMVGTSTGAKTSVTLSTGSSTMTGTFSTNLFGNVVLGTTYFINGITNTTTFTITASLPVGTPFALVSKTGAMNIAAVGWDHINQGTPISTSLDASSVYYIEPRISYSTPAFTQTNAISPITLAQGSTWNAIAYGNNYWLAVAGISSTAASTTDGSTWTSIAMPSSQTWSGIAYGNGYWVAVTTSNVVAVSKSNGQGWITSTLPSSTTWKYIVYGNGIFVAAASGQLSNTNVAGYSNDFGKTWAGSTLPSSSNWIGLAYGLGVFVAIAGGVGSTTAAWSANGQTWSATTLPAANWQSVAYGNGQFQAVAVAAGGTITAYSLDGKTWTSSNLSNISANIVVYGNGTFLTLLNSGSANSFTNEGGAKWQPQTVSNIQYNAVCYGVLPSGVGVFVTLGGVGTGTYISYGATARGRPSVTSGTITTVNQFEQGGGYTSTPTVTFTDPNVTTLAVVTPRVGNGVLGSPTFVNRGLGYNTTSTSVILTGNGYADIYQTGLTIIVNNLNRLPQPGDNLTITGISQIYKVTSAYSVYNTAVPNLEANVSVSPAITASNATANGTVISIRSKYSQCRLTNHDFLNIGYGDQANSNYPGFPLAGYVALSQNQTVEVNYGRVFYTSTDQDGNFKVGGLFGVQQATGIITLSATQFGLSGLSSLALGGIAVGGSSVTVTQFSPDATFTANSDSILSTQKAIKAYVASRLSQGGANTFTGQLIAGSVSVGSPNLISSSVPNGNPGSKVQMGGTYAAGVSPNTTNKTLFAGPTGNNPPTLPNFGSYGGGGVDGQMAAMCWWFQHISKKSF